MLPTGYKDYIREKIDEYIKNNQKLPHKSDMQDLAIEPLIFEYGNWKKALIELGYNNEETPESEFEALQELQKELNGAPTFSEAKENGINTKLLIKKYGSWMNVKTELRNHTNIRYYVRKNKRKEIEEKIKNEERKIIELTKKNKKVPTITYVKSNGINVNRILYKYGTWSNAKKELNLEKICEEK